jgi:hypothetical protein
LQQQPANAPQRGGRQRLQQQQGAQRIHPVRPPLVRPPVTVSKSLSFMAVMRAKPSQRSTSRGLMCALNDFKDGDTKLP